MAAAFALALRTISPSLSALHASRLRIQRPDDPLLTPLTCPRCGHAPVTTRLVRKRRSASRVVQRTCAVCDFVEALQAPSGGASQFENMGKRRRKAVDKPCVDTPSAGPSSAASFVRSTPTPLPQDTPRKPPPGSGASARPRTKKKSGLQEILARNRQRQEEQRQQAQHGTGGLSSFLDCL